MNRCRTILTDVQRGLARAGIGSVLVDLPGMGESEQALDDLTFADWTVAVADAVTAIGGEIHALAVRGGCLLDGVPAIRSRWHLAPIDGARLLRELDRAATVAGRDDGLRAGYPIGAALAEGLGGATVSAAERVRTVRLASDPAPADLYLDAAPPWRRSEPERDRALAEAIAQDVAEWIARCGD
jgi:hypothetical protein